MTTNDLINIAKQNESSIAVNWFQICGNIVDDIVETHIELLTLGYKPHKGTIYTDEKLSRLPDDIIVPQMTYILG